MLRSWYDCFIVPSFQVPDKRRLINVVSDSSEEDEDSEDEYSPQRSRRNEYRSSKWWVGGWPNLSKWT